MTLKMLVHPVPRLNGITGRNRIDDPT